MFLPRLSLSRILPAVMLSSGIWNLLTYNKSLDPSGGSVSRIMTVRRWLNEIAPPRQLNRWATREYEITNGRQGLLIVPT